MGNNGHPSHSRSVTIDLDGSEVKIEELIPKNHETTKIRISCWVQGRLRNSPLEISENGLVNLLQKAMRAGILSSDFMKDLHSDIEI